MPDCPVNYECYWSMRLVGPKVPDAGDWSMLIIGVVAVVAIITVGLLIALVVTTYADTHKEMSFKVK